MNLRKFCFYIGYRYHIFRTKYVLPLNMQVILFFAHFSISQNGNKLITEITVLEFFLHRLRDISLLLNINTLYLPVNKI